MYWLYAATVISGLTALLHIFGGGKTIARPLLESSLNEEAKLTNYYCWHIVTIIIIAMTICFFLAARSDEFRQLGILCSLLSLFFAIWSGILLYMKRPKPPVLQQWVLFLPISILSAVGLFVHGQ